MRVKCQSNTGGGLPTGIRDKALGLIADAEFPLTVGRSYAVYALTVFAGDTWYYLLDDDDRAVPIWYPAVLFEVTDESIPDDWVFGYVRPRSDDGGYPVVSFPEWALDRHFYERLAEGSAEAQEIFARRRASAERRSDG